LVTDKLKFYTGLAMLAVFTVLLTLMFMPLFDGKNALQYLDELYNSLSKGSAHFIVDLQEESLEYIGTSTDVVIEMESEEQAQQTAMLYEEAGAEVVILGVELEVKGDLGHILGTSLVDADAMYYNDAETVMDRYGYDARQVLYNWWVSLEETNKALEDQNTFDDAKFVRSVNEKGIEPAYNYFGIEPDSVSSRIGVVIFSLIFYVIYTIWYGFALMYIVEGLGLKIRQMFPFRFVARVKLT
jgi:hypothetical protein